MTTKKEPFPINHVHIVGRVGRDPKTLAGKGVRFSLAQGGNRKPNSDERFPTLWFEVVAWAGDCPDACNVKKGQLIEVRGRLKPTSWQKNGIDQHGMDIVASEVKLVESTTTTKPVSLGITDEDIPW